MTWVSNFSKTVGWRQLDAAPTFIIIKNPDANQVMGWICVRANTTTIFETIILYLLGRLLNSRLICNP